MSGKGAEGENYPLFAQERKTGETAACCSGYIPAFPSYKGKTIPRRGKGAGRALPCALTPPRHPRQAVRTAEKTAVCGVCSALLPESPRLIPQRTAIQNALPTHRNSWQHGEIQQEQLPWLSSLQRRGCPPAAMAKRGKMHRGRRLPGTGCFQRSACRTQRPGLSMRIRHEGARGRKLRCCAPKQQSGKVRQPDRPADIFPCASSTGTETARSAFCRPDNCFRKEDGGRGEGGKPLYKGVSLFLPV